MTSSRVLPPAWRFATKGRWRPWCRGSGFPAIVFGADAAGPVAGGTTVGEAVDGVATLEVAAGASVSVAEVPAMPTASTGSARTGAATAGAASCGCATCAAGSAGMRLTPLGCRSDGNSISPVIIARAAMQTTMTAVAAAAARALIRGAGVRTFAAIRNIATTACRGDRSAVVCVRAAPAGSDKRCRPAG
jgi:hypothetical protein